MTWRESPLLRNRWVIGLVLLLVLGRVVQFGASVEDTREVGRFIFTLASVLLAGLLVVYSWRRGSYISAFLFLLVGVFRSVHLMQFVLGTTG